MESAEKLKKHNVDLSDLNIISEIGLPEASLNVVRAGMGCAFVPSVMLDGEKDELKIIKIKNFNASRNYYLAVKNGVVIPEIAKNFIDLFMQLE